MKRLVIAAAAAAVLSLAGPATASADPPSGSETRCNGPSVVSPGITVTTCTVFQFWDYHAHVGYRGKLTVQNTTPSYTVLAAPDLLVGPTVYWGSTTSVPPGTTRELTGNLVQDPPSNQPKQGRGYLSASGWWTYTYAPTF